MARIDFRVPSAGVKPGTKVLLTSQGSDVGTATGDLFNQGNALKFHNGTSSKTVAFLDSNITGSAASWTTARTLYLTGDVEGNVSFDGTTNASLTATIAANSVALGTDTTGNYVASLVAGTGVTLANNTGEGATPTVSIGQAVATSDSPTFAGLTLSGDLAVNGADVTTTATGTATLFNTNATTLNIGGAATAVSIGAGTGTTTVNNNLTITGNLTINGTTTTVNATTVTVDDVILTLGGDTAPASDDNKDRGIEFRWHNGTTAKVGFFGFDDSTGKFTFIPDATNTSEVFSGTKGTLDVGSVEVSTLFVDSIEVDTTGATNGQVLAYNGTKFAPTAPGSSLTFTTISVAGQSDVVADSSADTLTLANGTGVTVTTNATTDTVTFSIGQAVGTTDTPTFAAVNVSDGTNNTREEFSSATLTTVTPTAVETLAAATYRSVKYVVQATQGTNYMVTEILAVHDGTNVSYTEYGTVVVGTQPATFDVDISGGNIRLMATSASSSSTVYRVRSSAVAV